MQEFTQRHKLAQPSFQVLESPGANKDDFLMVVCVGSYTQQGRGSTKKLAKLDCSKKIYAELRPVYAGENLDEDEDIDEDGEELEEVSIEEEEEEFVPDYQYADLEEFQGTVKSRIISEYDNFRTSHAASFAPVDIDNLPKLEDMQTQMSGSHIVVKEESDEFPLVSFFKALFSNI